MLCIQKNILLKNHTTFKIGGPAKYFFIAETKESLISAIEYAKKHKLLVFIMAGGSNLLISDKGFRGLVIKIQIGDYRIGGSKIFASAGTPLSKLLKLAADNGFSGLEWTAGIPGITVGGAIFGHAQAFGEKISDTIESVEVLDAGTLKTKKLTKKQCKFSLKNSIFKKNKNLIIISAVIKLKRSKKSVVVKKIKKYTDYRKKRHPINFPSAGSVFVNPEVVVRNKKLLEEFPELNEFNKTGVIRAGYLIEKAGLRGKKIGRAQISLQHANFIINLGGAKAEDVLKLIKLARQRVKKIFNIDLKQEIIWKP